VPDPEIPHIPGYDLETLLGRGGSGDVFAGWQHATGRSVAVKVLQRRWADEPRVADRMRTEWLVGRGLDHPNILRLLDFGTRDDGRCWLAMERLDGPHLGETIPEGGFPLSRGLRIGLQICRALAVLHRRGAVHRDLKPENVMLLAAGHDPRVKLVDLGLLALRRDDPARVHPTTGNVVIGTPQYMAPEQALGKPVEPRTDLYALGVLLYEVLSGEPPFDGPFTGMQALMAHVNRSPIPLATRLPGCPRKVAALVQACLAKDPADRPESAEAVASRLQALLGALPNDTAPPGVDPQRSPPPLPDDGSRDSFRHALLVWAAHRWGPAPPHSIAGARDTLLGHDEDVDRASEMAESMRREADAAVAELIERQRRLEEAREEIATALARHRAQAADRTRALMAVEAALESRDRELAEIVSALSATLSEDWHLSKAEVTRVSELIEETTEARRSEAEARAELRQAAAADARGAQDLRFQLIELDGSLQLLERERATRVAELETAATVAQDALFTARAARDDACMRLFVATLRAGSTGRHN